MFESTYEIMVVTSEEQCHRISRRPATQEIPDKRENTRKTKSED